MIALLLLTLGLRVWKLDQPIVENYVGRQVPTAMVARNLDRGSGFFHPELDTGPFPNLFLVEPPLYAAAVVGVRRLSGLSLAEAGRLTSALGMVLGAWGLFGLARRREGSRDALLAVAAFAIFPVTIRYGRAFQPDVLMLGTLLAGLRCWDDHEAEGGRLRLVGGWVLVASGLALKVVAAYILIPLIAAILRSRRPRKVALVASLLVPALLWYVYAAARISAGQGSRASADNRAIWLQVLFSGALFRRETLALIVRFFILRAFTPLGLAMGAAGLFLVRKGDRLWWIWGASALASMGVLAAKLHHEYYWLALAPVVAVGVGTTLGKILDRSRGLGVVTALGLASLALVQTSSTWRTPPEWAELRAAARYVQEKVPRDALVVAPEALLFEADRRGCRLEISPNAAARAAGEWGGTIDREDPLALVEFYHSKGAKYFADLESGGPERLALHKAIRGRYKVLVGSPGTLLADLTDLQGRAGWHPKNPP